jgi:hypothetical protein
VGVFKVHEDVSEKLEKPGTTGLAAVQVGYGFGFSALRVDRTSRSAASSLAYADG